ncbi:unnamed protein product [Heterobilharzia americana]|nr:unnamed protein product [Heterobilharzia americana]
MAGDDIEDELQVFGLVVDNKIVIEKFNHLKDKWGLTASTLAEKYVAFQRNTDLPDHISQKNVELFDRETSAKLEAVKNRTPKPQVTKPTKNLLTKNMLQELMVAEACADQHDLLSSYGVSKALPRTPDAHPAASNKENKPESNLQETQPITSYPADMTVFPVPCAPSGSIEWTPILLTAEAYCSGYMNQHALENAEILDNWTWRIIKRVLDSIPDELLVESDQKTQQSSQTINRDSFLSLVNKGDSSQLLKTENSSLERTTMLRPVFSRLQVPSLIPGRVSVKLTVPVKVPIEPSQTNENKRAIIETKTRLHLSNVALVGLRRVERSGFSKDLSCYSVYSGQPLLIRGVNPTGQSLGAMEIFQIPISKPPEINPNNCMESLHIMIACGPYTLSTSHDPTGLFNLLRSVKQSKPHILILLGPFVDSEHPSIESYSETTYEELFQSRVNSISEWCSHLSIKLVIVSSWRELHHDPVYPTPAIDKSWTEKTPDLLSSYEKFSLHLILDLSCEEISAGCSGSDRITRLCRHILASGSFYPFSVTPHCLILPSKLRQFAKDQY